MKPLQFILKFRRLALCIALAAYIFVIWAGLAHMGSPWVLVALVSLPALLIEAAIRCQWNKARCFEQLGRQLLHNSPEDGVASNGAWQNAVYRINKYGHLHANLTAHYLKSGDIIMIQFA